jgi:hypothetical protein
MELSDLQSRVDVVIRGLDGYWLPFADCRADLGGTRGNSRARTKGPAAEGNDRGDPNSSLSLLLGRVSPNPASLKTDAVLRPCPPVGAPTMFHYDEHEQHLKGDRGHGKEINRNHLTEVIVQEDLPRLAGRPRQSQEDSGDSAFGDLDAKHLQLAVNPGCAPERVGGNHPFDEASNLEGRRGSAAMARVHFRTAEPRTCEAARAASGRPCRLGRIPGERASQSTAGTSPPRTVGRRKSMWVASVFAGRQRVERVERRFRSR